MDYNNLGVTSPVASGQTLGVTTTISNISPTFSSVTRTTLPAVYNQYSIPQIQNTVEGFLTGRRPASGQLYPRGVYNK
jgi:hypothetical protein